MLCQPPFPEGGPLDSPPNIRAPPPVAPPSPVRDHEPDALSHTPYCLRSVYSNHVADLLNGLPPARFGLGRNYLETDPDNPIPWHVTDAVWERNTDTTHHGPKVEREALLKKYTPLLRPRSPTHRLDFPGPPPDGDPQPSTSRYPRRDDRRWTREESSSFLVEAMIPQFPPHTKGVIETRSWTKPKHADALQGMQPELDAMVAAHALKTRRYETFHVEWSEMQSQLRTKAAALRAQYARISEEVGRLHHLFVRARVRMDEYKAIREALVQQLDQTFALIGMVANTTGALFAVGRAVAQGVCPPGGCVYGELDVSDMLSLSPLILELLAVTTAACNAVPYLRAIFPEFSRKKKPFKAIPADPMAPDPSERPFADDMPTYDFYDVMALVWQNHPTKLQEVHRAVVERGFEGVRELTQREWNNVQVLLGRGGEWMD